MPTLLQALAYRERGYTASDWPTSLQLLELDLGSVAPTSISKPLFNKESLNLRARKQVKEHINKVRGFKLQQLSPRCLPTSIN